MAFIEGAQIFSNNVAVTDGGLSAVVDLGKMGDVYTTHFIDVKLTAGGGTLTGVSLQTSDTEAFTASQQVAVFSVPTTVDQSVPAQLLAFRIPFGMKRFARLSYAGAGTVFASVVTGVALQ